MKRRIAGIGLAALAVVLSTAYVFFLKPLNSFAKEERTTIPEGITIGGRDVSGMTIKEADEVIDSLVAELSGKKIKLVAGDKRLKVTAEELGIHAADSGLSERAMRYGQDGNLLYRFKAKQQIDNGEGCDFALDVAVDNAKVTRLLEENADKLATERVDNGLKRENGKFVFVAGKAGETIKVEKSAVEVADYIANKWDRKKGKVSLVTTKDEPKGDEKELESVKDVLGSFHTDFSTSTAARSQNVSNGASKINGTLLYPGDTFSVARTLNPMTAENGYAMAPSYENGTTVMTYGGGICQVSTTLYNAVIRAELEVTERHEHSMLVHYVEPSMDAAIAGDSKDFKFTNNTEHPVYLEGYTEGGIIYFNVYGKETREAGREVSFESEVLSTTNPKTIYSASSAPLGSIERTSGEAHVGHTARLWKIVTVNGKEESREVFNSSSYRATDNVYSVGTASSDSEASARVSAAIGSQDLGTIQSAISSAQSDIAQKEAEAAGDEKDKAAKDEKKKGKKASDKSKKQKSDQKSESKETEE